MSKDCGNIIPKIVRGSDKTLEIFLRGKHTKTPTDLTGATEVVVILGNDDGTFVEKKLSASGCSVISGPGGHIQAYLIAASGETDKLTLSAIQDDGLLSTGIQVNYTIAGKLDKVNIPSSIEVVDPMFPGAP